MLAVFAILLSQCANPVMPLGGIKDEIPPEMVGSHPEQFAVNFTGRLISIEFDEFIRFEKINQQALISPPPLTNPEFRIKGKSVQVRFNEDLKPQTTYTIFFGNAIVDLTENNPIEAFTFVFSTGNVLDSMSLAGNVKYAMNNKLADGAYVFLYRNDQDTIPVDSLPFKIKPYYVARVNVNGDFQFQNLRNEPYNMFVLEDKNSNFIYNKGSESIGFANDLVFPEYVKALPMDTTKKVALPKPAAQKNITTAPEIAKPKVPKSDSTLFIGRKKHELVLFPEPDSTQKLLRGELVHKGLLRFAFRYPATKVEVTALRSLPESFGLTKYYTPNYDTLLWFFRDKVIDSLQILVKQDTLIQDTLKLSLSPRTPTSAKRSTKNELKQNVLTFNSNVVNRALEAGEKLILTFSEPVLQYQMRDSSRFIAKTDTVYNTVNFKKIDTIGLQYMLDVENFVPDVSYHVLAPDSVFFGLNNTVNDTISIGFKIPAPSEYGQFFMKLEANENQLLIVQLLNQKEDVLRQKFMKGSSKIVFENLRAGKYMLRAIFDNNNNKRWDTGSLTKRIQPEKIVYFDKEINIRPNWEVEEEWDLRQK